MVNFTVQTSCMRQVLLLIVLVFSTAAMAQSEKFILEDNTMLFSPVVNGQSTVLSLNTGSLVCRILSDDQQTLHIESKSYSGTKVFFPIHQDVVPCMDPDAEKAKG